MAFLKSSPREYNQMIELKIESKIIGNTDNVNGRRLGFAFKTPAFFFTLYRSPPRCLLEALWTAPLPKRQSIPDSNSIPIPVFASEWRAFCPDRETQIDTKICRKLQKQLRPLITFCTAKQIILAVLPPCIPNVPLYLSFRVGERVVSMALPAGHVLRPCRCNFARIYQTI